MDAKLVFFFSTKNEHTELHTGVQNTSRFIDNFPTFCANELMLM